MLTWGLNNQHKNRNQNIGPPIYRSYILITKGNRHYQANMPGSCLYTKIQNVYFINK